MIRRFIKAEHIQNSGNFVEVVFDFPEGLADLFTEQNKTDLDAFGVPAALIDGWHASIVSEGFPKF